jgi:hypothetical protein
MTGGRGAQYDGRKGARIDVTRVRERRAKGKQGRVSKNRLHILAFNIKDPRLESGGETPPLQHESAIVRRRRDAAATA